MLNLFCFLYIFSKTDYFYYRFLANICQENSKSVSGRRKMWERVRWRTQSKGMLEDAFETADRHPPARPQPHHTHCNILHTLGHITPSRLSLPPHHKPRSRPGRFLPQQPVCTAYPGKSCLLHHLKKLLRRIDPLMNLFQQRTIPVHP